MRPPNYVVLSEGLSIWLYLKKKLHVDIFRNINMIINFRIEFEFMLMNQNLRLIDVRIINENFNNFF